MGKTETVRNPPFACDVYLHGRCECVCGARGADITHTFSNAVLVQNLRTGHRIVTHWKTVTCHALCPCLGMEPSNSKPPPPPPIHTCFTVFSLTFSRKSFVVAHPPPGILALGCSLLFCLSPGTYRGPQWILKPLKLGRLPHCHLLGPGRCW